MFSPFLAYNFVDVQQNASEARKMGSESENRDAESQINSQIADLEKDEWGGLIEIRRCVFSRSGSILHPRMAGGPAPSDSDDGEIPSLNRIWCL